MRASHVSTGDATRKGLTLSAFATRAIQETFVRVSCDKILHILTQGYFTPAFTFVCVPYA